jgi:hypothetical protein
MMLVTVSFIHNPKSIVTLSLLVYDLVITLKILTGVLPPSYLTASLTGCDRGGRKRAGSTSNQGPFLCLVS